MSRLRVLCLLCACSIFYVCHVNGQVAEPRITDTDVETIIHRIELRSDLFRGSLDSALGKSRHQKTEQDHVNSFIKNFDEQTKRLRDHFDQRSLITSDVQAVLDCATPIDDFMTRNRVSSEAQNDWTKLRNKLDRLAIAYRITWRWKSYRSNEPAADEAPVNKH